MTNFKVAFILVATLCVASILAYDGDTCCGLAKSEEASSAQYQLSKIKPAAKLTARSSMQLSHFMSITLIVLRNSVAWDFPKAGSQANGPLLLYSSYYPL
jgi:hypothetical protein